MMIFPVESGPVDTVGYLVADESGGSAVIIDTPLDSAQAFVGIINEKGLSVRAIILTHSHWDHTADAAALARLTNAPVMIHQDDAYRAQAPMDHVVWPLPFEIEAVEPDRYLVHGETLDCGSLSFEVRHTPGHTEGGICLVEHSQKSVFTGDTIFYENVGRVDLPGGSGEILLKSVKEQILTLPDDYKIYPGHGQDTTVGYEKDNNPFIIDESWL